MDVLHFYALCAIRNRKEGITKHEKMIVSGAVLDRYYVKSQALIDYVHEVIEKYGMTYE